MGATEIDAPFRLIKQPVRIGVGTGVSPMDPGTKTVGNLTPIHRNRRAQIDAMAWMQSVDGVASHLDLPGDRQCLERLGRLTRHIGAENDAASGLVAAAGIPHRAGGGPSKR